jgi:hypothetical protein
MRLELGRTAVEYFPVIDANYNLITGVTGFTSTIISPAEDLILNQVTITEMGAGKYKATYVPTTTGNWYMEVIQPTYFPYGKSDVIEVEQTEFNQQLLLGLNHNNFVIDTFAYNIDGNPTQARMKLYPNSGLTGSTIAEFQATSTYDVNGNQTYHGVRRVV